VMKRIKYNVIDHDRRAAYLKQQAEKASSKRKETLSKDIVDLKNDIKRLTDKLKDQSHHSNGELFVLRKRRFSQKKHLKKLEIELDLLQ
jgi:hypothetical protein